MPAANLWVLFFKPTQMPQSMRKLLMMLAASVTLFLGTLCGAHAAPAVPDRKVHATELRMFVPPEVTCTIDTVVATHTVILKPALGPLAPPSPVAVDGGIEYLALLRFMACPPDRCRRLISQLRNSEQKIDQFYPGRP